MSKKNLGVIFGSRSCEREVAVISAVQLMQHIDTDKYEITPVYIDEKGNWFTGDVLKETKTFCPFDAEKCGAEKVWLDMTSGSGALLSVKKSSGLFGKTEIVIKSRIDVFIIVMHGLNGEDGTLQGMLELANIPYTSTGVTGSAISMDKIMMKQFFRGADLPVLPSLWFTRKQYDNSPTEVTNQIGQTIGYPVFVKPANLGSSIGVSRADNECELHEALQLAFSYDRRVLVEKGLEKPIELNCSVLGYDDEVIASPIEMPLSGEQFLDFGEKYLANGGSKGMASLHRVLPAPIEDELRDEIQAMSCRIFQMMDCKGVVRIDYMYDRTENRFYITEINSIPGSLAFYLWENKGMAYRELIDNMVEYAMKAYEDKNSVCYAYTSDILKSAVLGCKGTKGTKGTKS